VRSSVANLPQHIVGEIGCRTFGRAAPSNAFAYAAGRTGGASSRVPFFFSAAVNDPYLQGTAAGMLASIKRRHRPRIAAAADGRVSSKRLQSAPASVGFFAR